MNNLEKQKEALMFEYAKLFETLRRTSDPVVRDRMNEITMELYTIDKELYGEGEECEDIDE